MIKQHNQLCGQQKFIEQKKHINGAFYDSDFRARNQIERVLFQ